MLGLNNTFYEKTSFLDRALRPDCDSNSLQLFPTNRTRCHYLHRPRPYSRTQVVPQTTEVDGAPWLYADTELEAYRHALLFKRMKEAKLRVSYPGKYYAYKDTAWFQWTPEQESNQPAEPSAIVDIYAFGDISITQDWKEIYKGQNQRTPHRVTLDPPQNPTHQTAGSERTPCTADRKRLLLDPGCRLASLLRRHRLELPLRLRSVAGR